MGGERISRPTVDGGTKDSEFEIAGRLETQFLSMNEGLRIQRLSVLTSEAHDRGCHELIAIQLTEKKFDPNGAEPHSRLCLPKDNSQLANINPTYESSSVNC